jgi:arabinofuranan 3-O-arabinosyltransferase
VPQRSGPTLLTLPQNVNAGWEATLDGERLVPTRTAGWKQAWLVPAGEAGTVRFEYRPQASLRRALLVGLAGLLVCLVVVLMPMPRRRPSVGELPPLEAAPVRPLDVALVVAAAGLLGGWWGVSAAVLAVATARLAQRRFSPWPVLAGLGLLGAALGLVWRPISERTWAVEWTQAWSLMAFVSVAAALTVTVRRRPRRAPRMTWRPPRMVGRIGRAPGAGR